MQPERTLYDRGYSVVVGLDEVGYGAWAGPVMVGAVCLPQVHTDAEEKDLRARLQGVKDSKAMTFRQRANAQDGIQAVALAWGLGAVTPDEINGGQVGNMRDAVYLAMHRAWDALVASAPPGLVPNAVLMDSLPWPGCPIRDEKACLRQPKMDQASLTVAAASVLAKHARDAHMIDLAREHPAYHFHTNMGYGTLAHRQALEQYGVIPGVHRRKYRPVMQHLLFPDP